MKIKIITVIWKLKKGNLKVKLLPVVKGNNVSLFIKEIYVNEGLVPTTDDEYEKLIEDVRALLPDSIQI